MRYNINASRIHVITLLKPIECRFDILSRIDCRRIARLEWILGCAKPRKIRGDNQITALSQSLAH